LYGGLRLYFDHFGDRIPDLAGPNSAVKV
jgi:hypothetical protein